MIIKGFEKGQSASMGNKGQSLDVTSNNHIRFDPKHAGKLFMDKDISTCRVWGGRVWVLKTDPIFIS